MRRFFVAAAGCVGLWGCSHTASLSGQVRSQAGGVAGATVRVLDSSQQEVQRARTDAEGRFAVRQKLEPKPYTLEISLDGYQPLRHTVEFPAERSVDLVLARQATVRGIVRLENQSVVPGASVAWVRGETEVRRVTSGADGVYVATGLDPGEYTVRASSGDGAFARSIEKVRITGAEGEIRQDLELQPVKLVVDGAKDEPGHAVGVGNEIPTQN
jgi:carboxypeptidase family protein